MRHGVRAMKNKLDLLWPHRIEARPLELGSIDSLEKLEETIKATDDIALPEDGRFYQNMHDQIMLKIQNQDWVEEETATQKLISRTLNGFL